jgi:hypothetical protein
MTRAAVCALGVLLALAGCGGGGRDGQAQPRPGNASAGRAPPQWVPLASFSGSGDASRTVQVSPDAVQWRTRWQCHSGQLTLTVAAPAPSGSPIRVDELCPSIGKAVWVGTGAQRLAVLASDRWRIVVEEYDAGRARTTSSH